MDKECIIKKRDKEIRKRKECETERKAKEDQEKGRQFMIQGQDTSNSEFIAITQNKQNTSQKEEIKKPVIHNQSKNQQKEQ